MIRFHAGLLMLVFFYSFQSIAEPAKPASIKIPTWSDTEKYLSKSGLQYPMRNKRVQIYLGADLGPKNGFGMDLQACFKLNRYLCAGARGFFGKLNSSGLVRQPTDLETAPNSTDYQDLLNSPESWTAFIPEVGLGVNTQIIPIAESLWSESAWFGVGKPFFGKGRSGWTFSAEGGVNHRFAQKSPWGFSVRGKYTFGWISSSNGQSDGVPIDWANLSVGIIYVW
jgi:hypothetical protein